MRILVKHTKSLLKVCIVLCVVWAGFMAVRLWLSGVEETKQAMNAGRRFIIHIADGRVEGRIVAQKEEAKIALALPPPPAPDAASEQAVDLSSIQPSSNPIVDVSQDMVDTSVGLPLPKIADSGAKPWQYYSKGFRRLNEFPLVAIIITGLGHSKQEMNLALKLDDRIGLSLSPYSAAVTSWAAASRMTGHEMYVELPMQTGNYPGDDPGPYSILVSRNNAENLKNLYWAMSRFQGYVGLVAPPGEVITHSVDTFGPLRSEIVRRGLMFLTGRDTALGEPEKKDKNPLVGMNADVWIDEELSELSIQARLAMLEQIAQRNGMAIGISRSYPLSINQIKQWQDAVGSRGIVLAPASFIAKLKYP